jgi:purine-binding chemotaxis protein CheW
MTNQRLGDTRDGRGHNWLALSQSAARSFDDAVVAEERRELLLVGAAGSQYAIPVERIREIVRLAAITRIPRMPSWLVGVVALRGEIVEVVDLRTRLRLTNAEPTRASRIVVIHEEEAGVVGILVDSVTGVLRASEQDVLPTDGRDFRAVVELVRVGEGFVGILDLERILGAGDDDWGG